MYTHPYGFSLDDSFNRDTDIMTYVSSGSYTTYIFTYNKAENIEKDFRKVCDIFLNKDLQSSELMTTYITKKDFDNFEEGLKDYKFNSLNFYCRISSLYSKANKEGFDEVDIVKGNEEYGK